MTIKPHRHHLADAAGIHRPRELLQGVHGLNARVAVVITDVLGSMPFYWLTNFLALVSFPAVLTLVSPSLKTLFPAWLIKASLISLISWVSSVYIQLTALPVLQVSNNAQGRQQEHDTQTLLADAETTREHTSRIVDALDLRTEGGLADVMAVINAGNAAGNATLEAILVALQAQADTEEK